MVVCLNNVVGAKARTIVKFDTLADLEFQRLVVDPLVRRRQQRLVFERLGVAIEKVIPGVTLHDHHFADVVVERQCDVHLAGSRPVQRIIRLAGHRVLGSQGNQSGGGGHCHN